MAKKKKNPTKAKAKADTTVRFIICPKYAGARPEAAPEYLDFIVRGGNPESKAHANSVGGEFESQFWPSLEHEFGPKAAAFGQCIVHFEGDPCGHIRLGEMKNLLDGKKNKTVMLHLHHEQPEARRTRMKTEKANMEAEQARSKAAQAKRAKSKHVPQSTRLTRSAKPEAMEKAINKDEASGGEKGTSDQEGEDSKLPKPQPAELPGLSTVLFQDCTSRRLDRAKATFTRRPGESDEDCVKRAEATLLEKFGLQADELQKTVTHDRGSSCGDKQWRDFRWLPAAEPTSLRGLPSSRTVMLHVAAASIARANQAAVDRVTAEEVNVTITFEQRKHIAAKPWGRTTTATAPWPPATFSLTSESELSELLVRCHGQLESRIRQDASNQRALDSREMRVGFRVSTQAPDTPSVHIDLGNGRLNVSVLGDLFRSPSISNKLDVHMVFALEATKVAVPAGDLLFWQPQRSQPYESIRVGLTTDQAPSKTSLGMDQDAGSRTILPIRPLLAWLIGGIFKLELFSIPAYQFDDHCIGDPCHDTMYWEEGHAAEDFASRHELLAPFAGEPDRDALDERVKIYQKSSSPMVVGSGMPFLPSYCFNKLDEAKHGAQRGINSKGASREDEVHVAVRCVSHLKSPIAYRPAGPDFIWFPDILLSIPVTRGAKTVCKRALGVLKASDVTTKVGEDNAKELYSSSALWERRLLGKWAVQIWVSPQRDGGEHKERKMYCLTRAQGEKRPLWWFLDTELWKKGDRRLYVEAHLVPKDLAAWTVTGTMVEPPTLITKCARSSDTTNEEHEEAVENALEAATVESSNEDQDFSEEHASESEHGRDTVAAAASAAAGPSAVVSVVATATVGANGLTDADDMNEADHEDMYAKG